MKTKTRRTRILGISLLLLAVIAAGLFLAVGKWMESREEDADAAPRRGNAASELWGENPDTERHEDVPESIRTLAEKNPDAAAFVDAYPWLSLRTYSAETIDLQNDLASGETPHLMQWDMRWGCAPYGESVLALSGCGPTCLSMTALALTGDEQANPLAVAQYSMSQGWYVEGAGSSWELMRAGAEHFGLVWEEIPLDEGAMRSALDAGKLLILSVLPGDFTENGHFIVLCGSTPEGFSVLDPNSFALSRVWSYDELCAQIANIWAYSAA